MDWSDQEVDPSEPLSPNHFRNISSFLAANNPTQLTKKLIKEFYSEYHIPKRVYHLYQPRENDRIYHTPTILSSFGGCAIGISEAAFICRFRVPLLQLLKNLFRQMNIAFSQMDPNRFIHINTFKNRPHGFSAFIMTSVGMPRAMVFTRLHVGVGVAAGVLQTQVIRRVTRIGAIW